MAGTIQPSFAKGEIAPALYGRTDTAAYLISLRTARNTQVAVSGGINNRPGTVFISPVKDHADAQVPWLYRFRFKTTDSYLLEFGDLYMRVIRNDGHVVESTKAISAATQADPVVVTTATHGYATGEEVFIDGIVGMTELNGRRFLITVLSSTTFSIQDQVTGADIDGTGFTAWSSAGTAARVFTLVTPYLIADVPELKMAQTADIITITHPSYDPRELQRTDHDAWTIPLITFGPEVADPTTLAVSVTGVDNNIFWKYKVTAVEAETFEESLAAVSSVGLTVVGIDNVNPVSVEITGHGLLTGDEVEFSGLTEMTELNGRRFILTKTDADNFTLDREDGTGYTDESTGGANTCRACFVGTGTAAAPTGTTVADNIVTWVAVVGAVKYNVYRAEGGKGSFGFISETSELTYTDKGAIVPDLTETPPQQRNPFFKDDDKPGAVGFYQQRRVMGGSVNQPDTKWYSQTGNRNNMNVADPVRASDAITTTLSAGQVNEIRHFVPGKDLIVLTEGSEWVVNKGDNVGFSANTLNQDPQTEWGSSHRRPIKIGSTIMFVQENEKIVRSLGFSFQADGYVSSDMTQFASHLFKAHTVVDWAYVRDPGTAVRVVRSDGQIAVLTFNQEQEVVAWTRWDTLGKYERVNAIRANAGDAFESGFHIVKRRIGGNDVRYIEREHTRVFTDIQDAYFVDSGLSLDSPIAITGATAADPVVVTAVAHGLSDGDTIDIEGINWVADFDADDNETQPDQLNGGQFLVSNKTNDTFEVQTLAAADVDGSAFNAYVDGGNVREAVLTVSGLRHLAGRTDVVALANGNVVSDLTVSATGTVTFVDRASRIHIGLKYIADIETLDIEAPASSRGGTIQDEKISIPKVTLRFEDTRGVLVGPNKNRLTEMKDRTFEDMGVPTNTITGDKKIILKASWNSNGRLFLRQRNPLPMTLLAAIPDVEVGDSGD